MQYSLLILGWQGAASILLVVFCPETPVDSIGCSENIAQPLAKEYGQGGSLSDP
jgi:hypothetical protein